MITNPRIVKCNDLKTLRDWKATKEKTILRSQEYIAQCELRIEQVKFDKQNQITMDEMTSKEPEPPKRKRRVPAWSPAAQEVSP